MKLQSLNALPVGIEEYFFVLDSPDLPFKLTRQKTMGMENVRMNEEKEANERWTNIVKFCEVVSIIYFSQSFDSVDMGAIGTVCQVYIGDMCANYVHPPVGVDILFLLFRRPPSGVHLVSVHLKKKYNSYRRQIWHVGLLGQ